MCIGIRGNTSRRNRVRRIHFGLIVTPERLWYIDNVIIINIIIIMVILDRDLVRELWSGNDFIVINIIIIIITVIAYGQIVKYVLYKVAETLRDACPRASSDFRSDDVFFPVQKQTSTVSQRICRITLLNTNR